MIEAQEATILEMLHTLSDSEKKMVIEHLRNYIEEIREENRWDESYRNTAKNLEKHARKIKEKIALGNVKPMDFTNS